MGTAMIVTAVLGFLGAVAYSLAKDEAGAWLPVLTKAIVASAVRRVPAEHRERYAEEFASHVQQYPGRIVPLIQAFRCLFAGMGMEEFSEAEIRRETFFAGILMLLNAVFTPILDAITGYNFWIDHLAGFISFSISMCLCRAAYMAIRFKPSIDRMADRRKS